MGNVHLFCVVHDSEEGVSVPRLGRFLPWEVSEPLDVAGGEQGSHLGDGDGVGGGMR